MSLQYDTTLTDQDRFPLMTDAGRKLMLRLIEHPQAPKYNHRCGDRLDRQSLEHVLNFEASLLSGKRDWRAGEIPVWVKPFAERCLQDVPIYRQSAASAHNFASLPTVNRANIAAEPWSFVPDGQALDSLIWYGTTGTSGHPMQVLSHPEVSSKYIVLLRQALRPHGVTIDGGNGTVAIVLVCAQNYTYTYASISSYLDQAAFLKLNLNPHEWKHPDDRVRFLDDLCAEIYTGDPVSFFELAKLPLKHQPKALVSTSMTLLPGWKKELENHFKCPVIDLYSSNECRLIAASLPSGGHQIVPHDLYVEILNEDGSACAPGVRGEITLTCDRNPFLPLLRYRTGDYASITYGAGAPVLNQLEGRPPTLFEATDGKILNNIDVSLILYPFPLVQFTLHQNVDRSVLFKMRGSCDPTAIRQVLLKIFGKDQALAIESLRETETVHGKLVQYTSDLDDIDLWRERAFQPITWEEILNPGR